MRTRPHSTAGFTLIELMVVVIVLSILAAVIVPRLAGRTEMARRSKARADIATLKGVLEQFYFDVRRYPTTSDGLEVLRNRPDDGGDLWKGPYTHEAIPNDPWGNPYVYVCPGIHNPESYDLESYGKDGEDGGEEDDADVESWQM